MKGKNAVEGLLKRLLPEHAEQFLVEEISKVNGNDVFEIESIDNKIVLRGSNGVSLASALNWYLKHSCDCHISWSGDQLSLPEKLPLVQQKIRKDTPYKKRYHFNFCTFNYSMTWWDWERWEREIDWMALHGINMPLAVTGQEAVWQAVGRRLDLSDQEILNFLPGPAFLAWNYMGNLDGIAGPLPQGWIDEQSKLQKKIIGREREFGMTPVTTGFYGHVPFAVKEKYANANITQLKSWFGLPGTYFLDPRDCLFTEIAHYFYEEQNRLYGTDHLYAMDLFHEGSSPNSSKEYLVQVSQAVCNQMVENDPKAIWVMQSWSMSEEMVRNLPDQHLLLLDLHAEVSPKWKSTDGFYGKPWVWCMLRNFGGRNGLFGSLEFIVNGPTEARYSKDKGNLIGLGFAPEAIEENPVFYDLLSEMIWREKPPKVEEWLNKFIKRRYGKQHTNAEMAWKLLHQSVYSGVNPNGTVDSVICARPSLEITKVCNGSIIPFYDLNIVAEAWGYLVKGARELKSSEAYQYDLINVGREVMAHISRPIYQELVRAFNAGDLILFNEYWGMFKSLIEDLDQLVSTNKHFLTGRWVRNALSWAKTSKERKFYEFNARTQISTWWPDVTFDDYAHKQWSGMFNSYYLQRWTQFANELKSKINAPISFDQKKFERDIRQWEIEWMHSTEDFKYIPVGDPISVSQQMYKKYMSIVKRFKETLKGQSTIL